MRANAASYKLSEHDEELLVNSIKTRDAKSAKEKLKKTVIELIPKVKQAKIMLDEGRDITMEEISEDDEELGKLANMEMEKTINTDSDRSKTDWDAVARVFDVAKERRDSETKSLAKKNTKDAGTSKDDAKKSSDVDEPSKSTDGNGKAMNE